MIARFCRRIGRSARIAAAWAGSTARASPPPARPAPAPPLPTSSWAIPVAVQNERWIAQSLTLKKGRTAHEPRAGSAPMDEGHVFRVKRHVWRIVSWSWGTIIFWLRQRWILRGCNERWTSSRSMRMNNRNPAAPRSLISTAAASLQHPSHSLAGPTSNQSAALACAIDPGTPHQKVAGSSS